MKHLVAYTAVGVLTTVAWSAQAFGDETVLAVKPDRAKGSYLRLSRDAQGEPSALQTAIVRFVPVSGNGSLAVDLVGAVHIGDREYYRQLNERFEQYDIVLYELLAPEGTRVPKGGGRSNDNPISMLQQMARNMLGLASQLKQIDYTKNNFVHADLSPAAMVATMRERGESGLTLALGAAAHVLRQANVDANRLQREGAAAEEAADWEELEPLALLFDSQREAKLKRMLAEQFGRMEADGGAMLGPVLDQMIVADRNAAAMRVLRRQLAQGHRRIAIFYGAAHMADFEKRLTSNYGLRRQDVDWVTAWDLTKRQPAGQADALRQLLRLFAP